MAKNKYRIQEYIDGVLDGSILVCKWTRLAVERHVRNLGRQNTPGFPYHFDEEKAHKPIDFISDYCYHIKGEYANKREYVKLEPWQQFITAVIFGWVDENGNRKYTTAFVEVAKKNGKSTWAAGLALYMFGPDGEQSPEIYSAATTKEQATIVFSEYAQKMVLKNPDLQEIFQSYKYSLTCEMNMGKFTAVASEKPQSLDGKNVHCAIIDEYHAHTTNEVYSIMRKGMGSRTQPLLFVITTAGHDPSVPCVDEEEYAQRVLQGKALNENYFGIIYTLDKDDDWRDERLWKKANPNLGTGKPIRTMREDFQKAVEMTTEQNKFKNKDLNIWTASEFAWIKDRDWKKVCKPFDLEELIGRECFGAIDLSKTIDTTAYGLVFPWEKIFRLYVRIFLPDEDLQEREEKERFEWRRMADEGHVILTPGRTVDYGFLQAMILEDNKKYDMKELAYDPYNSSTFITNLCKEGLEETVFEFNQTWRLISPAAKDFQMKILNEETEVYPNPVLDWMIDQAEVKTDEKGNILPVKAPRRSQTRHIDGVMVGLMALDRAVRNIKKKSVYENAEERENILIG